MTTNLEVYFCDLCNESVPQSEIESGKAARVKGRVIGSCCVGLLRRAPAAVAEKRATAGAGALLGVVLLAGIAGAATFLDWRLSDETSATNERLSQLEERLRQGQARMVGLEDGIAALGARTDLEKVLAQVGTFDGQLDKARASLELRITRLEEQLRARDDADESRLVEQRAAATSLHEALDRLGGEIAALRAMPQPVRQVEPASVPEPAAASAPAESAEPELPAELRHHVLALADMDPGTRFSAVDKLLRSKNELVLSALVPMAKDENLFVRRLTVEGLREFRRPEAVDALVVALADPESMVRLTANSSLRALTGQKFEFDDGDAASRAAGQRRWQEWWEKNRASFAF